MPYTAKELELIRLGLLKNIDQPTTRSRNLPPKRPGRSKRDIRTVSFNANPLAGAAPMPPGHRSASAIRSAIRSLSYHEQIIKPDNEEEPERYSDESICKQLHELRAETVKFASLFQVIPQRYRKRQPLDTLLTNKSNIETVAFASWLILEGPDGRESWEQFFDNEVAVQGLVVGLITRTLKEQVFDLPYFGATEDEEQRLNEWQQNATKLHGFERRRQCKALVEDIAKKSNAFEADTARQTLEGRVLAQLFKLVEPLYKLGGKVAWPEKYAEELLPSLKPILSKAILCAHDMRRSPHTAFEWTDVFKDFEFDPKLAECFNVAEMFERSPYAKHPETGRAILKSEQDGRKQSIIVGIVSPGLVGYRQGKVEERLLEQNAADDGRPNVVRAPSTGFQRQVLMKNVVLLRWGTQSLRTRYLGDPQGYEQALARREKEDESVTLWDLFVEHHKK